GVYEFPRSELLLNDLRFIKKDSLQQELADLKQKLDTAPNPVQYCKLADVYKEIGDYDKALELCKKAIELFPDHEGPWIIFGKIRLERFKEDWIAKDALLTIQHYEKALELNNTSYKTLVDLAELYTEIGAKRRATKKCESILYFAPEDGKALGLLQKLQQMQEQRREDVEELTKAYAEKKRKSAQRRGRKPGEQLGPSQRLQKDPELLKKKLSTLRNMPGFYVAVGIDLTGKFLGSFSTRAVDEGSIADAMHRVFESAIDCSLRMDIGQFKRGIFEGDSGLVYLIVFDEVRIAILCDPPAKRDKVEDAATKFIEDELYR
ncbi:MAG TPA: tetratricopeptide repeat protein, partial [Planctomycetota bacterium]|nr:tetratricopeptide repeat protein [Planctomycetota bacterium]